MSATTAMRINLTALTATLHLAINMYTETVAFDPVTGDYRVYFLGMAATPAGDAVLTCELHRQGPGFARRFFNVLSLTLGPCGSDGLCPVESFSSSASANMAQLPQIMTRLTPIAAALKDKQRPDDKFLLPLLSWPAQILWMRALAKRNAA